MPHWSWDMNRVVQILGAGIFLFVLSCSGHASNPVPPDPSSSHDPLLNQMLLERDKTQQVLNDYAILQKDRYLAGEISKEELQSLIDAKFSLEKQKLSETLRILEEQNPR